MLREKKRRKIDVPEFFLRKPFVVGTISLPSLSHLFFPSLRNKVNQPFERGEHNNGIGGLALSLTYSLDAYGTNGEKKATQVAEEEWHTGEKNGTGHSERFLLSHSNNAGQKRRRQSCSEEETHFR